MNITLPRHLSQRLAGALALVLLLTLGLVAGLSALQTQPLNAGLARLSERTLPALHRVHLLAGVVDELRGLSALHLLRSSEPGPAALEARLQALRRQAETLVARCGQPPPADADELAHCQAVQAGLARFLAALDRLLAASRRAAADAQEAAQARALLGGESQLAYQQLSADIAAWWAYQQAQADKASRRAQQQAQSASTGLVGLAGLAALLAAGVAAALLGRGGAAGRARHRVAAARADAPAPAAQQAHTLLAGLRGAGLAGSGLAGTGGAGTGGSGGSGHPPPIADGPLQAPATGRARRQRLAVPIDEARPST